MVYGGVAIQVRIRKVRRSNMTLCIRVKSECSMRRGTAVIDVQKLCGAVEYS